MNADVIWQAFAKTGDPVFYLLYQAVTRGAKGKGREKQARDEAVAG